MSRQPTDHQREELRDELHKTIDHIINAWPHIHRQAQDMGGGYPTNTLGDNTSGSHTDGALLRAMALNKDLATRSNTWLRHLDQFIATARIINASAERLVPLTDDELEQARERKNTAENCIKCGLTAPKIHRIDGQPYCANTCYFQEWRARQRANAQTG